MNMVFDAAMKIGFSGRSHLRASLPHLDSLRTLCVVRQWKETWIKKPKQVYPIFEVGHNLKR
jgi:hypothetical protein